MYLCVMTYKGPNTIHQNTWNTVILSEVSQRKKISYDIPYMGNINNKWANLQKRNKVTDVEIKCMVPGERGRGRNKLGDWDGPIHTTIYKEITNKEGPTV